MQFVKECSLIDFEFWSGGRAMAEYLTIEELQLVEHYLEDSPELMSETGINDFFCFDSEFIVTEILGYSNWDSFIESRED